MLTIKEWLKLKNTAQFILHFDKQEKRYYAIRKKDNKKFLQGECIEEDFLDGKLYSLYIGVFLSDNITVMIDEYEEGSFVQNFPKEINELI